MRRRSFGEKTFCWLRQVGGKNIVGTVHAAAGSDAFLEFQSQLFVLVSDVNADFFKNQLQFQLFMEYATEGADISVPVQSAYEAGTKQLLTPDMDSNGVPACKEKTCRQVPPSAATEQQRSKSKL